MLINEKEVEATLCTASHPMVFPSPLPYSVFGFVHIIFFRKRKLYNFVFILEISFLLLSLFTCTIILQNKLNTFINLKEV